VPRYVTIRASTTFSPTDFDNWEGVFFARIFLIGALLTCIYLSFALNLTQSSAPAVAGARKVTDRSDVAAPLKQS